MNNYPKVIFYISDKAHDGLEEELSYEDWNDFELCYEEGQYFFSVETMLGFKEENGAKRWMEYCLECLTKWMHKHCYATNRELNLYEVFTDGKNINDRFNSIEDAYAAMKFWVRGFDGVGMFTGGKE